MMGKIQKNKSLLIPCIAVLAAIALVTGGASIWLLGEQKTDSCNRELSTLSPKDMSARVIRNLLFAEMKASERESGDRVRYRTFLIRKSMSSADVIDAIATRSITHLQNDAAYPLNTTQEVESVAPQFFQGEFSIVRYWASSDAEIIPSKSIEVADADEMRHFFDGEKGDALKLSPSEAAQGYGTHLYRLSVFGYIDLGCCEERYFRSPKEGKQPEWYARRNIDSVRRGDSPVRRYLVVSDCGEILHRNRDGFLQFLF